MTTTDNVAAATSNGVDPHFQTIDVTPQLAAEWLTLNRHNRPLREKVAQTYAADMAAGDWRWTGETVKFADDGTLIDGQHRLRAVVIADATVPMLVVTGLAPEAQQDVDRGVPRKFADVLKLRGENNAITLAAIVRRVHQWEAGFRRNLDTGATATTVAQMLRTLDARPELREISVEANRIAQNTDLPASVVGLCMWVFDALDPEDSRHFFARLTDGTGHSKGEPHLRTSPDPCRHKGRAWRAITDVSDGHHDQGVERLPRGPHSRHLQVASRRISARSVPRAGMTVRHLIKEAGWTG